MKSAKSRVWCTCIICVFACFVTYVLDMLGMFRLLATDILVSLACLFACWVCLHALPVLNTYVSWKLAQMFYVHTCFCACCRCLSIMFYISKFKFLKLWYLNVCFQLPCFFNYTSFIFIDSNLKSYILNLI